MCFLVGLCKFLLVLGIDGVGIKLELVQEYGSYYGVGIDLVVMCVNDVIILGVVLFFFLDYMVIGVLVLLVMVEVVEGIVDGCRQSGCVLFGGEMVEMLGFYLKGCYDFVGFCVVVVEEDEFIDGQFIQFGDSVIGVVSSGVYSNGFSLVCKVLEKVNVNVNIFYGDDQCFLIGDLLVLIILYVELVQYLLQSGCEFYGMVYIIGGGFLENFLCCLLDGCFVCIDVFSWIRLFLF